MSKKKIIFIIVIIGLIIFGIYQKFLKKKEPIFTIFEVTKGNVVQEISETGTVKMGEEIDLSFKNTGRIEEINIIIGDVVEPGQSLARQSTDQLYIRLQEAQASLKVSQAKLDKLLSGSSKEEIQIAETDVQNKEIALETAQENLDQAYEDALNILDDSYLNIYNVLNKVTDIQGNYFTVNDVESTKVKDSKTEIENSVSSAKHYLDIAVSSDTNENIDQALSEMTDSLGSISNALAVIREMCEQPFYRSDVSSTDKASLDTHRDNINTALTNITDSQQTITSKKLSLDSATGNLKAAKDQLALVLAEPRQEDINVYEAQIGQVEAQIDLIKNQIEDAKIISPTRGQVTKIAREVGEMVQSAQIVISLIPDNPFQIKTDIYEEDIIKVDIGDPVDIIIVAFPENIFLGRVIAIDPAEKLIEGVVYYEVTIEFEETPLKIKPGMTADIIIKTDSRDAVLVIPEESVMKKEGKTEVLILEGREKRAREIEIGLVGSEKVEVISGLVEGEKVIIE